MNSGQKRILKVGEEEVFGETEMQTLPHGTDMVYGCVEKKGITGEAQKSMQPPKRTLLSKSK